MMLSARSVSQKRKYMFIFKKREYETCCPSYGAHFQRSCQFQFENEKSMNFLLHHARTSGVKNYLLKNIKIVASLYLLLEKQRSLSLFFMSLDGCSRDIRQSRLFFGLSTIYRVSLLLKMHVDIHIPNRDSFTPETVVSVFRALGCQLLCRFLMTNIGSCS